MGLLLVQAMRHMGGSRIVVVEKQPERRNLALSMGTDTAIAPDADYTKQLFALAPMDMPLSLKRPECLRSSSTACNFYNRVDNICSLG
jgi:threonine dehydrogenase-like Zn-dependent dehydrogenase